MNQNRVQSAMLNKKRPLKKSSTALITQILGMITQIYYRDLIGVILFSSVKSEIVRVFRQSQKGLTLIEVLIALVVTLVLFLALMQSALLSINSNTRNVLRDEAVSIAEMRMRELRGLPFDHADLVEPGPGVEASIPRDFRKFTVVGFTPTVTITDIPPPPGNPNAKQIEITINWTVPGGESFSHTISTIKRG